MLRRLIFLAVALVALAGLALADTCSTSGAAYTAAFTCNTGDKLFVFGTPTGVPTTASLAVTEDDVSGKWTVSLSDTEALPSLSFTYSIQVTDPDMHIDSVFADFIQNGGSGEPAYTKTLTDADGEFVAELDVAIGHRGPEVDGLDYTFLNVADTYVANGGDILAIDNVFHQASDDVPEPTTFVLFGGAVALLAIGRRLW
jgi:hypothetical protein